MGFILPPQQGVIQKQRHVAGVKIERHFLVFPQKLASLHLDTRNRKRDELSDRPLVGGKAYLRRGHVGGAIRIGNDVGDRMVQHQRMQSNCGAEQRNDFQLCLQAVDPEKWNLIRSFATVDREVAGVYAQAERDGVKFAEFDAAARDFLERCDHSAADRLLKRIRSDIPAEQAESNQGENAKQQKKFPQNAPALRGRRLARWLGRLIDRWIGRMLARLVGHGVRSPALDSGVKIWLPERRFASHTESSSFIFRSASKSLIWPKTSVNGAAGLPARFMSGSN